MNRISYTHRFHEEQADTVLCSQQYRSLDHSGDIVHKHQDIHKKEIHFELMRQLTDEAMKVEYSIIKIYNI